MDVVRGQVALEAGRQTHILNPSASHGRVRSQFEYFWRFIYTGFVILRDKRVSATNTSFRCCGKSLMLDLF